MDLMTDEELDGYSVLILFIVKRKNSLPSKKSKGIWVSEIFKKRATYGLYNLVHELRIGNREFFFE